IPRRPPIRPLFPYTTLFRSDERPWDYIEAVYLTGTIDDIQRQIQERIDAGVEHLILHTMTPELRQLELFARHILEPFEDGRRPRSEEHTSELQSLAYLVCRL